MLILSRNSVDATGCLAKCPAHSGTAFSVIKEYLLCENDGTKKARQAILEVKCEATDYRLHFDCVRHMHRLRRRNTDESARHERHVDHGLYRSRCLSGC